MSLSEICAFNPRVDKTTLDSSSVVSFVPMSAVEAETGKVDVRETRNFEQVRKGYTPFRKDDILFAKITPCMENGKMAVVPELASTYGFGSTEFHVLRPFDDIDPQFIYYAISNRAFRFRAEHKMTGAVGQKRVPGAVLKQHEIDLPPANEQRRIVEKIESLFAEIDKGIEGLQAAKNLISLFRQSLLKSAFEGRLTADWRAENPDKLENPETLLVRIRKEREANYQAALADWEQAVAEWHESGKQGKKPNKPKDLIKFTEQSNHKPSGEVEYPKEWLCLSLANLGQVTGGLTKNQSRNNLPLAVKYLRVANVYSNRLDLREIKKIGITVDELQKTRLQTGDILFVEGNGSIDQIGRVSIWDGSIANISHQNHLIRFRTYGSLVPKFALFFLMSPKGRNLVVTQASSTSGLHTLSISKVQSLRIPFCSPNEQIQIVKTLDARFEALDVLQTEIDASLVHAAALRQSILKQAFSGKLVPQDPNDEPAAVLLDRIRAERAREQRKPAPRKRKATHR